MTSLAHADTPSLLTQLTDWAEHPASELGIRVETVRENPGWVVRAELPGLDPATDLDVQVAGDVLRLRAHRREETRRDGHSEFRYGFLERVLRLPAGTVVDEVSADYADGVLTVSLPVRPTATAPEKIAITRRKLPVE